MEARTTVLDREVEQNYPLIAEVIMTKQIVVVIALHNGFAWCECRPGTNKYITVRETDLRFHKPNFEGGRSA